MLYGLVAGSLCFLLGLLTLDGGVAAALVGGVLWEAGGWQWAAPLLVFFVTSAAATRFRRKRKSELRLPSGPRTSSQVFANGGMAATFAALYWYSGNPAHGAGALASLAAANADTWATEFGTAFCGKTFRITTLKEAQTGSNGAVSVHGLVFAFIGAALVAACAPGLGLTAHMGAVASVGFAGSLVDSLLGDTVEGRVKWVGNDLVNFLATASAGVAGYFLAAA